MKPEHAQVASVLASLWTEIQRSEDPEAPRAFVVDAVRAFESEFGPVGIDIDDLLFRLEVGLLIERES